MLFNHPNYKVSNANIWHGRLDGMSREMMRWHQMIEIVDLREVTSYHNAIVFIGFCCDEGVSRNQGRVGAQEAPLALRKALATLPVHYAEGLKLMDAGDICCDNKDMEGAQLVLAEAIAEILAGGGFPLVLGGGHEVTYGHYQGIRKHVQQETIGVINIDAHLDCRATVAGKGNSGTGFYQIANDCEDGQADFQYMAIGIQQISNTKALFDFAASKGVKLITRTDFCAPNIEQLKAKITAFAATVDHVYLTVDMDAFAAAFAPGVSAPAYNGILPDDTFYTVYSTISSLSNLRTVDIAELNPCYDNDSITARLAAYLIFRLVNQRNPSMK